MKFEINPKLIELRQKRLIERGMILDLRGTTPEQRAKTLRWLYAKSFVTQESHERFENLGVAIGVLENGDFDWCTAEDHDPETFIADEDDCWYEHELVSVFETEIPL